MSSILDTQISGLSLHLGNSIQNGKIEKIKKWPYLRHLAFNQKRKDALFSSTLKVEEKKVPLVFGLEPKLPRYGHVDFNKFSDGLDDDSFVDKDGDLWKVDEYGDRSYMWDYM